MYELLDELIGENPQNIKKIKRELLGYIDGDPWFQSDYFKKAVEHVLESIESDRLFEELSFPIENDKRKWDKEYYCKIRVDLEYNFSRQGLEHLYRIAKEIYNQRPKNDVEQGTEKTAPRSKKKLVIIIAIVLVLVISILVIYQK